MLPGALSGRVSQKLREYMSPFGLINHNSRMYLLAAVFMAVCVSIQAVLYNLYLIDLGITEVGIGQVASAAALGVACGGIPSGIIYDRIGGKSALALASGWIALSLVLRAGATEILWLIVSAAIYGIGSSLFFVSIFPYIISQSTARERSHLLSANMAVWTGFMMIGSILAGVLPNLLGALVPTGRFLLLERYSLFLAAGIAALSIVPIAFIQPESCDGPSPGRAEPFPSLSTMKAFFSGSIVVFLVGISTGLASPFINVYFRRTFNASDPTIGVILSLSQLAALASAVFVPWVVHHWGLVRTPSLLLALTAPFTICIGVSIGLRATVSMFLISVGLERLADTPLMNLVMEAVPPGERGAMSGIRVLTNYGAQAIAGAVGGLLVTVNGYGLLFGLAGAVQLVAAIALWGLFRRREDSLETQAR